MHRLRVVVSMGFLQAALDDTAARALRFRVKRSKLLWRNTCCSQPSVPRARPMRFGAAWLGRDWQAPPRRPHRLSQIRGCRASAGSLALLGWESWTTICWPRHNISTLCVRPSVDTKTGVLILSNGSSTRNNMARLGACPVRTALAPIIRSAISCISSATAASRTSISTAGIVRVKIPVFVASVYLSPKLSICTFVASMSCHPAMDGALPLTGMRQISGSKKTLTVCCGAIQQRLEISVGDGSRRPED